MGVGMGRYEMNSFLAFLFLRLLSSSFWDLGKPC